MKPAIVVSIAIVVAAMMVSNSVSKLQQSLARLAPRDRSDFANYPSKIRVEPPPGGFQVTGDFQRTIEQRVSGPTAGTGTVAADSYAQVSNIWLVERRVTPEQLAAAPQTLLGRWRDENSYAEYRSDRTCTWTHDSGEVRHSRWRIEGDTIFETASDGNFKTQRRILELDDRHFVYQQFPGGSVWRASRAPVAPAEKEP